MTEAAAGRRGLGWAEAQAREQSENLGLSSALQADSQELSDLLRALLAVNGRLAFPEEHLRELVSPTSNSAYFIAYRLCDGRTGITELAKQAGVDKGNLSKAVAKWVDAGIAFRVGPKRLPLHLYPLSVDDTNGKADGKDPAEPSRSRGRRKKAPPAAEPPGDDDDEMLGARERQQEDG